MTAERTRRISACPSWLGLSPERDAFVYLEERASVVRKIFELSIGGFGSYAIAKYLNSQGLPPFPPSSRWDHTTIDSMLRNRATVGEHQPKSYAANNKKGIPVGAPIFNYYPAVITEDVFQAAQVARQNNLAVRRGRKGDAFTNLFEGLARCDYCRRAVKFSSYGNRKGLICESVLSNEGCIRAGWSYENFEQSVFLFMRHPALREVVRAEQKPVLDELVQLIANSAEEQLATMRFEIVALLRRSIGDLTLACAGLSPKPTLPGALIRRDLPNRFFRIQLWNGQLYRGFPVPVPERASAV